MRHVQVAAATDPVLVLLGHQGQHQPQARGRVILVTESGTGDKAGYLLENAFPAIDEEARLLRVAQVRALHRRKTGSPPLRAPASV